MSFLGIFHFLFFVGLAKRTWNKHRNDFVVRALAAMFAPKEKQESLSIAKKTASRTMLIPYKFQGEEYEIVMPVRRRRLAWDMCYAEIKNKGKTDVTAHVKKLAGPYGDFYGGHKNGLKAHQIVRNASKLTFIKEDREVFVIE